MSSHMKGRVAVVGAGVMGLTTAVLLRESGYDPVVFADEWEATTSSVAPALWLPYDAEPERLVTAWALLSYGRFQELARVPGTGVSMVDFQYRSLRENAALPLWAESIGYRRLGRGEHFSSGFQTRVPLMDTTHYLGYLRQRAGLTEGSVQRGHLPSLEEIPDNFRLVVNCAGYGARSLVPDEHMEPRRGQLVVVERLEKKQAFVLDEPLTYVIPRENDCVFGGVNMLSDSTVPDDDLTNQIVNRCSRMLELPAPPQIRATLVGIRPKRNIGVRVEPSWLEDGRVVIHNYGHGGCGLSLSWGCAQKAVELVRTFTVVRTR